MMEDAPTAAPPEQIKEGDLVLVTGGGGFIGSHCVRALLEKGFRVRATVRDPDAPKNAFLKTFHPKAATDLELVPADLLKPDGWTAALQGVDGVLHVASPFPIPEPADEQKVIRPAVEGVERVLKGCASAKVKRVVLTSSVYAVTQLPKDEVAAANRIFTEEDWSDVDAQKGYSKSKTLAEKKGWELAKSLGIDLVTVLPAFVVGRALSESAAKDSTSNQTIANMMLRKNPALPRCGFAIVDVEDVAELHCRALTAPRGVVVGKRFLAVGKDVMYLTEMSTTLHDEFVQYGFNPTTREAPKWLLWMMSWVNKEAAFALPLVGFPLRSSGALSKLLLGMQYKEIRQSLKEHVLSLIAFGILSPRQVPKEMYAPFKGET